MRVLILVPLAPIILAVYLVGQDQRKGLFDATLVADATFAADATIPLSPPVYLPTSDFTLVDTIQTYDEKNLYKKINGHDVAFFRFGFQMLTFASYGGSDDTFLDTYLYRMGSRENALGIFANERSDDREPLDRIGTGYRSGGGIFFYRGPWYVQIIPSVDNSATAAAADEMTDSLLAVLPAPQAPIPQLAWFPESKRIALSEGYIPDNAFGTDFLGDVFTAQYELADSRVTAFRHRSDSATVVFDRYGTFLTEMATPLDPIVAGESEVLRFSSYGEETWMTIAGDDIIGITGIPEAARPTQLMEDLLDIAKSTPPEGSPS
ncbi:MAG: hypothetical protein GF341_04500 [candidate division Zixibacteria bacterium]|nr:hypothetical protein [candidate division Zixibacteria bacterium]